VTPRVLIHTRIGLSSGYQLASGLPLRCLAVASRLVSDDLTDALWKKFKSSGDDGAREKLIIHYAPLVKDAAKHFEASLRTPVPLADLVSYGLLGLIDCLIEYEPGRHERFEAFARPRIERAILQELDLQSGGEGLRGWR
jgi:DNA-directed RNA polymerase specialized sigma subunit